jgi:hypothetical protein
MRAALYTCVLTAFQVGRDPGWASVLTAVIFLLLAFPLTYRFCLWGLRKQDAREAAWLRHD